MHELLAAWKLQIPVKRAPIANYRHPTVTQQLPKRWKLRSWSPRAGKSNNRLANERGSLVISRPICKEVLVVSYVLRIQVCDPAAHVHRHSSQAHLVKIEPPGCNYIVGGNEGSTIRSSSSSISSIAGFLLVLSVLSVLGEFALLCPDPLLVDVKGSYFTLVTCNSFTYLGENHLRNHGVREPESVFFLPHLLDFRLRGGVLSLRPEALHHRALAKHFVH
mmetsp:Transcript_32187/g.52204  ORF Transcript_32187/g.52204 Transcript_32187/m.52204 type:complete len:220 (-) Transcript_32187:629-1288(-)